MTPLEQFKRGGRGLTLSEWHELTPEAQVEAIEIEKTLLAEQAALIAYFMLNPRAMLDRLGGDDAVVRAVLEGLVK